MSDINPRALKVAELREELKNRDLDATGLKAVLIERLDQKIDGLNKNNSLTKHT